MWVPLRDEQMVAQRQRAAINARDRELLNRYADEFNAEAEDVLEFQTLPEEG